MLDSQELSEVTGRSSSVGSEANAGGPKRTCLDILSKKSSAQMGFRVNSVLARDSCI